MAYKRNSRIQHKFKKAKPKGTDSEKLKAIKKKEARTYKGFVYASKEEVICAKLLDDNKLNWEYEKYSFTLIDDFYCPNTVVVHKEGKRKGQKYKAFEESSKKVQDCVYTPDFVNWEEGWIIEVKGIRDQYYVLREKLFKKYLVEKGLTFDFYVPNTKEEMEQTIRFIHQKKLEKVNKAA